MKLWVTESTESNIDLIKFETYKLTQKVDEPNGELQACKKKKESYPPQSNVLSCEYIVLKIKYFTFEISDKPFIY